MFGLHVSGGGRWTIRPAGSFPEAKGLMEKSNGVFFSDGAVAPGNLFLCNRAVASLIWQCGAKWKQVRVEDGCFVFALPCKDIGEMQTSLKAQGVHIRVVN